MRKNYITILLALGLLASFAGCDPSDVRVTGGKINAKVQHGENYNDKIDVVKLTHLGSSKIAGEGKYEDGGFKMKLEKPKSNYLEPIYKVFPKELRYTQNTNAYILSLPHFEAYKNNKKVGTIIWTKNVVNYPVDWKDAIGLLLAAHNTVWFVYSTEDVNVGGTDNNGNKYDLILKEGWNTMAYIQDGDKYKCTTVIKLLDFRWHFIESGEN